MLVLRYLEEATVITKTGRPTVMALSGDFTIKQQYSTDENGQAAV
jgi:hypothetical protein